MKLRIIILLFAILFSCHSVYAQSGYQIYVNGMPISVKTITRNNLVYLPADMVAGKLGLSFEWNPISNNVLIAGRNVTNQALFYEGSLYLPAQIFALASNYNADVDASRKVVYVTGKASQNTGAAPSAYGGSQTSGKAVPRVQPLGSRTSMTASSPGAANPQTPYAQTNAVSKNAIGKDDIPQAYNTYPTSGTTQENSDALVRPLNAPPSLSGGMRMPMEGDPMGVYNPASSTTVAGVGNYPAIQSFTPVTERNSTFSVTVTNIEELPQLKNYYTPTAGSKYVVVYVSQQNVSPQVQIYTGKFSIADESSRVYDYQEGLSNYWLTILKPGGVNYGYLVFEIPQYSKPTALILHAVNTPPLTIKLDG